MRRIFFLTLLCLISILVIKVLTDTVLQSVQVSSNGQLRNVGVSLESLSYTEVINLSEENDIMPNNSVSLSPDGTTIAWEINQKLCLQVLNQSEDCSAMPENFKRGTPSLQWSPDGQYIAFQENALVYFIDADVWLFDVEEQTIINLTDDGDAEFGLSEAETDTWMDTVMTWGPDNQIYLLRTAIAKGKERDDRTFELLHIDPDTGDITLIQDLTGMFEQFPVFYQRQHSLDGVMSVSPDATQLALSVLEFDQDSSNNGIWLIDLSGGNDPQHIATPDQFMSGYSPEVNEDNAYEIQSLAWDAEGMGLYVYALSTKDILQGNMVYHMDLDSGDVVPLIDLSAYTKDELFESLFPEEYGEDSLLAESEFIPYAPVLSPDYRGVIVASGDRTAILAIPFDEQPGEPVTLYEAEKIELFGSTSMMGIDGTALIAGNLLISD